MTDETARIMAKANETMARSNREQLSVAQRVAAGEMSKAEALETLGELEKLDMDLIADIDRRIEALGEGPQGDQGGAGRSLFPGRKNWVVWQVLVPLAIFGSFAAWVIVSSLKRG